MRWRGNPWARIGQAAPGLAAHDHQAAEAFAMSGGPVDCPLQQILPRSIADDDEFAFVENGSAAVAVDGGIVEFGADPLDGSVIW